MPDQERRQRSLTDQDVAALLKAFEGAHCIPMEEHKSHHDFIRLMVENQKSKTERWEKVKTNVWGWMIITVLGGIGTAVYHGWQFLREHLK